MRFQNTSILRLMSSRPIWSILCFHRWFTYRVRTELGDEREREIVIRHFVEGWGISQSFIEAQYDFLVADGGQFDVEAWSEAIGQLSESKDISSRRDLRRFDLRAGSRRGCRRGSRESENQAIEEIRATLVRESKFLGINSSSVSDFVSGRALSVKDSSVAKWITKLFVAGDRKVSKSVEASH